MTGTVAYVLLNGKVKAVEQQLASLPKGINFKGAVDYVNSLPPNAELGDTYTVKYHGTSGTVPYGAEFAWGEYDGTQQWIKLGADSDMQDVTLEEYIAMPTSQQNNGTYWCIIES